MESAGSNEDRVARARCEGVDTMGDAAVSEGVFEVSTGDSIFQSDVKFRARFAIGDEPHFGLWFAAEHGCKVAGRMDLNG